MDLESIVVPVVLFLSPALIVWIVSHFNARKRATVHETLGLAIDKGQVLCPQRMDKMSLLSDPARADLRRSGLALAFGAAFAVLGALISLEEHQALTPKLGLACFPIFIGVVCIGLWAFGREEPAAE